MRFLVPTRAQIEDRAAPPSADEIAADPYRAEESEMPSDAETDRAAIHGVAETLRSAVNAGDVTGILTCWAHDGILLPPHHPAVHGHAAIAKYFRDLFATRRLTFTFTESAILVFGEAALERLSYTAVSAALKGGGNTSDDVGKGLHVYARRPDGAWQLTHDIWNSDRPVVSTTRGSC